MPVIGRDHFTDTSGVWLTSHTPDVGGPWVGVNIPQPDGDLQISLNQLGFRLVGPPDVQIYYLSGAGSVADAYIQATYFSFGSDFMHLCGRIQSVIPYKCVQLFPGTILNTLILLDENLHPTTFTGCAWAPGVVIRMEIQGSTVKAYFGGVLKGSISTGLGAGHWGMRFDPGGM